MSLTQSIRDFGLLRGTALLAAMGISFEAESDLARLIGVGTAVSLLMPIAIDCLMVAALRSRQAGAIACASLLMGAANATSHLLSHDTPQADKVTIATVSVVPVVVILLLELLVPAVSQRESETPEPVVTQPESAVIHAETVWPVSLATAETLAVLHDTPSDALGESRETPREPVPETVTHPETADDAPSPADETPDMPRDKAVKLAEELYAYGLSARKAAEQIPGWSHSTVSRWFNEFRDAGVKKLELHST